MELLWSEEWWINLLCIVITTIVFICGCIAVYYAMRTRAISKQTQQEPDVCFRKEEHKSIDLLPVALGALYIGCFGFASCEVIPWQYCCPILQISICFCLWISICVCVIIQEKGDEPNNLEGIHG